MFCITKWTTAITDSGKDEYTKRMPIMREKLVEKFGEVPELFSFACLMMTEKFMLMGKALTTVVLLLLTAICMITDAQRFSTRIKLLECMKHYKEGFNHD